MLPETTENKWQCHEVFGRVDSKSRHQNQHRKGTRLFSRLLPRLVKKNTKQKWFTLEMMVSQLDSTCDDTNRASTQLPAYDIHSVYFGENQSRNSYWYHG